MFSRIGGANEKQIKQRSDLVDVGLINANVRKTYRLKITHGIGGISYLQDNKVTKTKSVDEVIITVHDNKT